MAPAPSLFLEAEPAEDLVVLSLPGVSSLGGAKNAPEWLRQALCSDRLVCATRTPDGILSVVVGESFLSKVELPKDVEIERQWASLRLDKSTLEPHVALGAGFASVCQVLEEAGIELRAVSTLDSECFLFQSRQLPDAAAALLAAGHVISPSTRIATPLPSGLLSRHDRFRRFAGAWRLLRQEPEAACFGGGSMRLQASCGVFVDVSIPPSGAVSDQASSAGCLEVRGDVTFRHRLVSFQPPSGDVLQADLSLEESDQLIEELRARGRSSGSRCRESWERLASGNLAVAMELVSEVPERSVRRQGCWVFAAGRFARVLGPAQGSGLVAGTCCSSLGQLQQIRGESRVAEELQTHYEAVCGFVEQPGLLKIDRKAFSTDGGVFFDANGQGGKILVPDKPGAEVVHVLSEGMEQRWRVLEWGFDPFTPGAPPVAEDALPAEEASSPARGKDNSPSSKKRKAGSDEESISSDERHRRKKEKKREKKERKEKEKEEERQKEEREKEKEEKKKDKKKKKDKDKDRDDSSDADTKKKDKEKTKNRSRSRSGSRSKAKASSRSRSRSRKKEKKDKKKEKKEKKDKKDSSDAGSGDAGAEPMRDGGRIRIALKATAGRAAAEKTSSKKTEDAPPVPAGGDVPLDPPPGPIFSQPPAPAPPLPVPSTVAAAPSPGAAPAQQAVAGSQGGLPENFKFPQGYPPPPPEKVDDVSANFSLPVNFKFPQGYPPPRPEQEQPASSGSLPANFRFPQGYPPPPSSATSPTGAAAAAATAAAAAGALPPGTTQVVVVPSSVPGAPPLVISTQGTALAGLSSAQIQALLAQLPPLKAPAPAGVTLAPAMLQAAPMPLDPVSQFLSVHQVDHRAAAALRMLPLELQYRIIGEGPLTGGNPSAVLAMRITKLEVPGAVPSAGSTMPAPATSAYGTQPAYGAQPAYGTQPSPFGFQQLQAGFTAPAQLLQYGPPPGTTMGQYLPPPPGFLPPFPGGLRPLVAGAYGKAGLLAPPLPPPGPCFR